MYPTHTWVELQTALAKQFPSFASRGPNFMNGVYCAVTRDWVAGPFMRYYRAYLAARGQTQYNKRGNQCEHYAIRAAMEAVDLFRQADDPEIPDDAESLAVCWFSYFRADGKGWHEANLWYVGGVWTPWEPQTQLFFELVGCEITTAQAFACP